MRTMRDQLISKGLSKQQPEKKKAEKRPKETLSDRDLAELMGTNRNTYRRVRGGAMRQS